MQNQNFESSKIKSGGPRLNAGRKHKWGKGVKLVQVRLPKDLAKPLLQVASDTWNNRRKQDIDCDEIRLNLEPELDKDLSTHTCENRSSFQPVRMYEGFVAASFNRTSLVDQDDVGEEVDLHHHLVKSPDKTFLARVVGDSMLGVIEPGDLLVVESISGTFTEPRNGNIVIAQVNDEITVKEFRREQGKIYLDPKNLNYEQLEVTAEMNFRVLGIVKHIIRAV